MLDMMLTTFVNIFAGPTFIYLLVGVFLGLVIGVLPALGTTAGIALLIPFIFGMDLMSGVALMTGLLAVVATGDVVTSILMGFPGGGGGSQATVLDGFPMAKRGEGARALSAAYFSSLLGGIFGAMILTGAILVARPVVLSFGLGELLLLTILGVTMVSTLSGASLVKGLISCGIGLIVAAVGQAPATAEYRMIVGDIYYLSDGLPLAAVALAIFAFPEIVSLLRAQTQIADRPLVGGGWIQGIRDTLRNKWLVLRCSAIGCLIGALPIGGSEWFAYGHAVQTCKPKENFGKGDVRGVIAPEAANNAAAGGALLPTLIFGIPGSGSTAIFLSGLVLLGVVPGPSMVGTHLDVTYTIIWSLALANIIGAGICFMLAGQMARLTTIPIAYLAVVLLAVVFFGAYQSSRQWGDFGLLFVVGVFALYMRRFGYSRPAFLIGFILAGYVETYMYQTYQVYTPERFFSRPLVWVLITINVAAIYFGLRNRPKLATEGETAEMTKADRKPQIAFLLLLGAIPAYCLYNVSGLTFLGKVFPATIAAITLTLVVIGLVILTRSGNDDPIIFDAEYTPPGGTPVYPVSMYHYLAWLAGLMATIYLVGFILALILFIPTFLRAEARGRWWVIALLTACVIGVLSAFSHYVVVDFPSGLLQRYVELPWPIR